MNFTFGIVTGGNNEENLNFIVDSIERENIPTYEIIIVGNCETQRDNCTTIPFDESIAPGWITKKKNIITRRAAYENIVYFHDYIKFKEGWYEGQLRSGDDFKVRMDRIINFNGERFRDWCIWPNNDNPMDETIGRECLIPYSMTHLSKYMYFSGAYWVAKRDVMTEFPLDERLLWGQGEDVLWSMQVREKYNFDINERSSVQIMKPGKDRVFDETSDIKIAILNKIK